VPASVAALRALISQRFPDAAPIIHRSTEPVASGVGELDRILPGGGFPRGKLSIWEPNGGVSAVLRAACRTTLANGERAAWIDAAGVIIGPAWEDGPLLFRPKDRIHALRGAEELLGSGGFSLVVLTGAESQGTETVRLTRAARDGGGALVALTTGVSMASLRLTSRLLPHSYRWRRDPFGDPAEARLVVMRVRARALGWNAATEFPIAVMHTDLRSALEPGLADRRGVLKR
jgi:hypothetical protein